MPRVLEMLLSMSLLVAESKRGGWHVEHNFAGPVRDEVCRGVRGWGAVGAPRLPCIGKYEVDRGAALAVKPSRSVADKGVKPSWRRVGTANIRVERTIRRHESVVEVETMFVPR